LAVVPKIRVSNMLGIDMTAARYAWTYAVVALLIYGAFIVRKTVLMFIIALMVAYLLYPMVEAVDRRLRCKSRTVAVLCPFVLFFALLAGIMFIIRPTVHKDIEQFREAQRQQTFKIQLAKWKVWGVPVGQLVLDKSRLKQLVDLIPKDAPKVATREIEHAFVIPILTFFFLLDGAKIYDGIMEIIFGANYGIDLSAEGRGAIESILKDAHFMILEYMRALLLLCLATLICFGIALNWMAVPYATLLALFACPLEFLPLVGPLLSAIVIIVVSGLDTSSVAGGVNAGTKAPHLLWVILFLGGYRLFQDYVLSPHLMKKGMKLHPLLVVFGVFAGGEIGGVGGIFLSVPVLALVRLVYYEWRKRRTILKTLVKTEAVTSGTS